MKELPIHIQLNPESDKCLYEQIYEFVRDEIRAGNLLQNEKLPSSRYLAEYLQVSRTTVDMAYGQLVSEGYLEARPQKGYFVCAIEESLVGMRFGFKCDCGSPTIFCGFSFVLVHRISFVGGFQHPPVFLCICVILYFIYR